MTPAAPLYLARSLALPGADAASLQLFPPGTHRLAPLNSATGETEEITLTIDPATAATLEAARAEMQARADAGDGDAPFIDFNHDDREAAGWVKKIHWAGDDPKNGGVRAEIEWTSAGREAVEGRTFRRFSPAFHAEAGRVTGAPVNMGGLVNRAAFRAIAPLFAKQSTTTDDDSMKDDPATQALEAENAQLKTDLAAAQEKAGQLEAALAAMQKKDAEATVELAAQEGRIPAAPEMKAKWVAAILADPASAELLAAIAPHPALLAKATTPAPAKEDETKDTPAELLAKYHELPRDDRPAFYAKHKEALKSALR